MIELYSGTPGSGKSLNMAKTILENLRIWKKDVIANTPINMDIVTKKGKVKTGKFTYLKNDEMTVEYLINYAIKNHKPGREGQTILVIDECAMMFNSRDYSTWDRKSWINFFMTHRHYGYDVILISQHDRLIDRQIRAFIEYNVVHRKANNFGLIGGLFTIMRIKLFVAVKLWYAIKLKCDAKFFIYRKKYSRLYDTMMLFGGDKHGESIKKEEKLSEAIENVEDGGGSVAEGGPIEDINNCVA